MYVFVCLRLCVVCSSICVFLIDTKPTTAIGPNSKAIYCLFSIDATKKSNSLRCCIQFEWKYTAMSSKMHTQKSFPKHTLILKWSSLVGYRVTQKKCDENKRKTSTTCIQLWQTRTMKTRDDFDMHTVCFCCCLSCFAFCCYLFSIEQDTKYHSETVTETVPSR